MAKTWTDGTWSGLPNYECGLCPFSTLNEDEMVRHAMGRHGARARSTLGHIGSLAGVDFASDNTAEAAADYAKMGLDAEHFDFEPSGQGGYTMTDLTRAARAAGLIPEED